MHARGELWGVGASRFGISPGRIIIAQRRVKWSAVPGLVLGDPELVELLIDVVERVA